MLYRLLIPLTFVSLNAVAQNGPYEGPDVPKQVEQLIDLMERSSPEAVMISQRYIASRFDIPPNGPKHIKPPKDKDDVRPEFILPPKPFPTRK